MLGQDGAANITNTVGLTKFRQMVADELNVDLRSENTIHRMSSKKCISLTQKIVCHQLIKDHPTNVRPSGRREGITRRASPYDVKVAGLEVICVIKV